MLEWCNGSHEGLKIPWTETSVPVRVRPRVQCNDLVIGDGTDAMYEMETFEARTKVPIRNTPYRHYITWFRSSVG
jgi:hypothetical protein